MGYVALMYPLDRIALHGKGNQQGHFYYYFQAAGGGGGVDRKCLVAASTNATHHPLAMPVQKSSQVCLSPYQDLVSICL